MNKKYTKLLSPYSIGSVEIRNRAVMPAMGTNMSDGGFVNQSIINHYKERSKGGMGLIIVEVTCVSAPQGKNTINMLVLDDDKYIEGMRNLTNEIHENGAKCFLQISHTGRGARRHITGVQPVGPSPVAMPYSFMMGLENEEPIELTIEEINEIEDKYAQAARRAKESGFDGIEIHSCGYYLGEQFLSSKANIRIDKYGGNVENRCLFHRNIIFKIKEICGDDFPIIIKMPAIEIGSDAGITIEEGIYYAKRFQDVGADAIEVLAGKWQSEATIDDIPDTGSKKGSAIRLVAALKMGIKNITGQDATIKFIGGGRSQYPDIAEEALQNGICDFIFMGKGSIAEPNLINLISKGKEEEIRPCIGCGTCINEQLQGGMPIKCSGNAVVGNEDNDYTLTDTKTKKHIVIVGGGVAGSEAARISSKRGHKVTLIEKSNYIGGQMIYVKAPPHKENTSAFIPYIENQLKKYDIDIRLGCVATKDIILGLEPDVVVCATGVKSPVIPIPGFDKALHAKDVLLGEDVGEKVAIIGGGIVGCELGEFLASKGKQVHIIEMQEDVATKMVKVGRTILLGHLKHYGVNILTSCICKKIDDDGILYIDNEDNEVYLAVDNIIESIGDHPETSLYDSLEGEINQLYKIGDCISPTSISKSISDGYFFAKHI